MKSVKLCTLGPGVEFRHTEDFILVSRVGFAAGPDLVQARSVQTGALTYLDEDLEVIIDGENGGGAG